MIIAALAWIVKALNLVVSGRNFAVLGKFLHPIFVSQRSGVQVFRKGPTSVGLDWLPRSSPGWGFVSMGEACHCLRMARPAHNCSNYSIANNAVVVPSLRIINWRGRDVRGCAAAAARCLAGWLGDVGGVALGEDGVVPPAPGPVKLTEALCEVPVEGPPTPPVVQRPRQSRGSLGLYCSRNTVGPGCTARGRLILVRSFTSGLHGRAVGVGPIGDGRHEFFRT